MTDPLQPPHTAISQPEDSWFKRNWWWSVPGGCCGCFVVIFGILLVVTLVFGVSVLKEVSDLELEEDALRIAELHPVLEAEVGTPMRTGFSGSSSVDLSAGSEKAEFSKTLSGPEGRGTLTATAEMINGEWTFTTLSVELDNGETIDLLEE